MRSLGLLLLPCLAACSSANVMTEIVVVGTGQGTVTAGPVSCAIGERCELHQPAQATATPHGETVFFGWFGGRCSGTRECPITVTSEKQRVYAAFGAPGSLVVAPSGTGAGFIEGGGLACGAGLDDCALEHVNGTIELKATPNPNSVFERWTGACEGTGPCVVSASGEAQLVTARFTRMVPVLISLTGPGTVVSDELKLTCTSSCTTQVALDSRLVLRALPSPGARFSSWSGAGYETNERLEITVQSAVTIAAVFQAVQLTLNANPPYVIIPGTTQLQASGGQPPYTFTSSLGTLDRDTLTLTTSGTAVVTVQDANGVTMTTYVSAGQQYPSSTVLNVSPSAPSLRAGERVQFTVQSGTAPFTWSTTAGSIDANGLFTAPLDQGYASVTVMDAAGARGYAYPAIAVEFEVFGRQPDMVPSGPTAMGPLDDERRPLVLFVAPDGVQRVDVYGSGLVGGTTQLLAVADAGSLAVSDWNRDGRADVLVGVGNQLELALGDDAGVHRVESIALPHRSEQLVASVFDAEGTRALVSRGEGRLAVVKAVDGGLGVATELDSRTDALGIETADLDRDGRTDLLVLRSGGLETQRGLGSGTFDAARVITTTQHPERFVVGDFTGDGWADVLTAEGRAVTLFVNVRGVLTPLAPHQLDVTHIDALGSINQNFDDRRDVVIVSGTMTLILCPDALGEFTNVYAPGMQGTRAVLTGDWNRDRQDDLLLLGASGSVLLRNRFYGWAEFAGLTRHAALTGTQLVTGDWNRDGRDDLAWISDAGVERALSSDAGPAPLSPILPGATSMTSCDWNRDDQLDLAVSTADGVTVLLGAGDGTFAATTSVLTAAPLTQLLTGDWNGDGRVDLAGLDVAAGVVHLLEQTSDGALTARLVLPTRGAKALQRADFDGDGVDELLCAEADVDGVGAFDTPGVSLFRGAQRASSTQLNDIRSMVVVDSNLDGRLDVVIGSSFGVYVALGLSSGHLGVPAPIYGTRGGKALALAQGRSVGEPSFWWAADDGTLRLVRGSNFPQSSVFADSVAEGDFNGDGLTDVAALSPTTGLSIWPRR